MFEYLKALAARLMRQGFGGSPPGPPYDPHVGVREPRKRGPGGGTTAVALAEPKEPGTVRAHGDGRGWAPEAER
jgi:hypothetical protein